MGDFVDELIAVNSRISRRLVRQGERLFTSTGVLVNPSFTYVSTVTFFDRSSENEYLFQLGQGEHRAGRSVTQEEAHLALGYDFKTVEEPKDIGAMLKACEQTRNINAYFLGMNINRGDYNGWTRWEVPVAYFKIPEKIHKSVRVSPKDKEYKDIASRLRCF
jgi:hypothetical protein